MNDIQRNAQDLVAAPEPDGCIAAQTYMSSSLLPLTMSTERQGDAQMQPAPEPTDIGNPISPEAESNHDQT